MKKTALFFIRFLMWLVSKIYTYGMAQRFCAWGNLLYSLWIRSFIGHVGESVIIDRPCSLSGGGHRFITIGNDVHIQSHCILGCWVKYGNLPFSPTITIGDRCDIGEYNHISACNKIIIGDGFLSGRFVYIGDNSHGEFNSEHLSIPPSNRDLISKGDIIIGRNVWVGDKVTIVAGVHLGDNVIVAANSVVTKDFPSNCLIGGVPAKILKQIEAAV